MLLTKHTNYIIQTGRAFKQLLHAEVNQLPATAFLMLMVTNDYVNSFREARINDASGFVCIDGLLPNFQGKNFV